MSQQKNSNFHHFIRDENGWETIRNEILCANPHVQVLISHVKTPTRSEPCTWTVVHRKAAVVVAPVTAAGEFILVRQERIPIRSTIWEFPAGQIDDATEQDESLILRTAERELREEAGYELAPAGKFTSLGYFFPSAGFTDEHSHLYLANPVVPSSEGTSPDENEAITECRAFTLAELRKMIAQNEIRDANTLAAFARLCALGLT